MVVFIMGLTAAVIAPNFPVLFDRLAFSNVRETFFRQINTLPYAAYDAGQDLVLIDEVSVLNLSDSNEQQSQRTPDSGTLGTNAPFRSANLKQATLVVPEGWTIQIPKPVYYRASGFCTGGNIRISVGALTYDYVLTSPYCQISQ